MAEEKTRRRLAAIMAVDVVGYTRMMRQDEAGTLALLKARRRDILTPLAAEHGGRIVKVMGDGALLEFGSAVEAVSCAVELQERFGRADQGLPDERRIVLRIGINLGDVIVDGHDLYGDGVNVAARLEGLAEPGGICMSGSVREQVGRKLAGHAGEALEQLGKALRLNPFPPAYYYLLQGQALYGARRYEEAVEVLKRKRPTGDNGRFLAASLAQLGRAEEARWEAEAFLVINPHFTIGHWAATQPIRDDGVREHFVEGYRKAGLPE
jgi:class 3 adenylate cyclase